MSADAGIILASGSRYRGELLRRLLPAFEQCAPGVDEAPLPREAPAARAMRLAAAKAQAAASAAGAAIVIGADQVAALDGVLLHKPGDAAAACAQLALCSARAVDFHTGLCVLDTRGADVVRSIHLDTTRVRFRPLDADTIARYVAREQPLDCAGSFKCEGLGIALFEAIDSSDPTGLIGLPLIALARLLRDHGIEIP
ncbi:MAG TPA: Maf family nucleotide pyrophosphatase [Rhodanobacteraceae bacterium]|jgi:septum formation protein|nr:Maf family nucleotide pyrophosphatase [Rhodanobacteraceae bacterium]